MFLLKPLVFASSIAGVIATPVPNWPSRVQRREAPTPPTYPLGDACGNEWQYLNFDTTVDADKGHLETLHNLICSGQVRAYLSWGVVSAQKDNEIYKDFFGDDDD